MRVLIVTEEMLPGGVAKHVIDLANGITRRNHDVAVASSNAEWTELLSPRVHYLEIPLLKPNNYDKTILGLPRSLISLIKFQKIFKADIIHTHKRYSDILGRIIARLTKVPHVATCHSTFDGGRLYSIFGDHTIAVSKAIEKMLIDKYRKSPNKVSTIYNEIRPLNQYSDAKVLELKQQYGIDENDTIIACIAQFLDTKDHITLLTALEIVKNHGKAQSILCMLIGHGHLKSNLVKFVDEHRLNQIVRFLPGTTNVEQIFNISDFCILSSIRDGGIPYVIMEGACLKKPFIATEVGGIPEFIKHQENGMLVPQRHPIAMAEAIEQMLDNPKEVKRMGGKAEEYYKMHHSSEAFIDKTISVYEKAMKST